jgi:ribosomal protein S17E
MIDEGDIPDFDSWYADTKLEWEGSTGSSEKVDCDVVPMHLTTASFEGKDTKNYRELVFTLPDQFKKSDEDFMDINHFPTLKNPILHVRLADVRPVAGDSKVLLVDEIQSEAHQAGKNKEAVSLPFKEEKKWGLIGLKKAMMEAAEKGYDEVAFTTGRMQALRNKQIQEVDGVEKGGVKMQQFYDKTLMKLLKTNFADKYDVKITTKDFKQNDKVVKLPVIQMTNKMRNDILKGLPMFSEGGEVNKINGIKSSALSKGSTIAALTSNLKEGK